MCLCVTHCLVFHPYATQTYSGAIATLFCLLLNQRHSPQDASCWNRRIVFLSLSFSRQWTFPENTSWLSDITPSHLICDSPYPSHPLLLQFRKIASISYILAQDMMQSRKVRTWHPSKLAKHGVGALAGNSKFDLRGGGRLSVCLPKAGMHNGPELNVTDVKVTKYNQGIGLSGVVLPETCQFFNQSGRRSDSVYLLL